MPDLNSVPASPLALAASRRTPGTEMPPPPAPTQNATASVPNSSSQSSSINILPSNQSAIGHSRSTSISQYHGSSGASPQLTATQPLQPQSGEGSGPGPLRHPRPLTTAELHMQLEKEQEAVVNRLTRELSLLRAAQNASVVSNASSASAHDPVAEASLLSGSGFSIPTARRHHRNSSSASQTAQLASSYEARHHATRPAQPMPLSRQSSTSRISRTNSPGPQSFDPSSYFHSQRVPQGSSAAQGSVAATPGSMSVTDQLSPGLMPATQRYEETAFYRCELDAAKKENDTLKRRIRELERMVQSRRASDASRPRSDSVSTTASMSVAPSGGVSIAGPRDSSIHRPERERGLTTQSVASASGSLAVGVPDDEVKVGESAASSGRPQAT